MRITIISLIVFLFTSCSSERLPDNAVKQENGSVVLKISQRELTKAPKLTTDALFPAHYKSVEIKKFHAPSDKYETFVEQVMVQEAYNGCSYSEARFDKVSTKTLIIKPPPANRNKYRKVEEWITLKPAYSKWECEQSVVFENVNHEVQVTYPRPGIPNSYKTIVQKRVKAVKPCDCTETKVEAQKEFLTHYVVNN